MQDFNNKIAVVTGGGTGMGRELVCQLIAAGAHVAMCDVSAENMADTQRIAGALGSGRLTSHLCDVSSEPDVLRFRDEVAQQQNTSHINLLFNKNKVINNDLLNEYFLPTSNNKQQIGKELADYFDDFYNFCFELDNNSVLKGQINFKY